MSSLESRQWVAALHHETMGRVPRGTLTAIRAVCALIPPGQRLTLADLVTRVLSHGAESTGEPIRVANAVIEYARYHRAIRFQLVTSSCIRSH